MTFLTWQPSWRSYFWDTTEILVSSSFVLRHVILIYIFYWRACYRIFKDLLINNVIYFTMVT